MSHNRTKVEVTYQEGWAPEEKYKFIMDRNNSCDHITVWENGKHLFSMPEDVFHRFLDLLNDDEKNYDTLIQRPTQEDLAEVGLYKAPINKAA